MGKDPVTTCVFMARDIVLPDQTRMLDALGFLFNGSGHVYKNTIRKTSTRIYITIL